MSHRTPRRRPPNATSAAPLDPRLTVTLVSAVRRADRLKGTKVETVSDPHTGRAADIRLRKHDMRFWAVVGDEHGESTEARVVRTWVERMLARGEAVTWTGVIEVTLGDHYSHRERDEPDVKRVNLSVEVERYWIARSPSGLWRRLDWSHGDEDGATALAPEERMSAARDFDAANPSRWDMDKGKRPPATFTLPRTVGRAMYLPYDAATWRGMVAVLATIRRSEETLQEMLTQREGLAALRALGTGEGSATLLLGPAPTTTASGTVSA